MEEAKVSATREVWEGAVRRFRSFEETYWANDNIQNPVDPIIITIDSDDEDDLFLDIDDDFE